MDAKAETIEWSKGYKWTLDPAYLYTAYPSTACSGRNEILMSWEECRALCDAHADCVSFEYPKAGTGYTTCRMSSTCTHGVLPFP